MLTDTRLLHAQNVILYSTVDRQISSIANESGFNDLAYFSKIFKKKVGKTPREYREDARQNRIV